MSQTIANTLDCPREELFLYLEGELSAANELLFEKHLAECPNCHNDLNSQKQLLNALNFAFEDNTDVIELPEDFAKVVATNAETKVSGLRSKKERLMALALGLGVFLLCLIGLSVENQQYFNAFNQFGKQIIAILSFIFKLSADFTVALAVILRSLSHYFVSNSLLLVLSFAILITSLITLSKILLRPNRF